MLNKRLAVLPSRSKLYNLLNKTTVAIAQLACGIGTVAAASIKALATTEQKVTVSAKLRAVYTQAADALECERGDSAQPSNRHHPIVAEAVNQTAQAKKAFSKLSNVQADKTRGNGSRSVEIMMVC